MQKQGYCRWTKNQTRKRVRCSGAPLVRERFFCSPLSPNHNVVKGDPPSMVQNKSDKTYQAGDHVLNIVMGERGGGNQNTILSLFGFFGHLLSKRHRKYEECRLSAGAVFGAKRARCSARGGSRDTYSRNPSVIHGTGSPLTGAGSMFLTWEPTPSSVSTFIYVAPPFQPVCFCSVRASAKHLFWRRSASDNGV